ncbi:MAG: ribbon-helix-helix protein, CopG family [Myxococcales bacterium]|nr:ribbon-helix-helix protein, CopG family [Myxococcales bacterium]
MRTTLTLDDDVAERLQALAARSKASFKATVNEVIRRGLTAQERASRPSKPFRLEPFRSAFRIGVDPVRLNQINDDLEAEHALERAAAGGGP